MCVCVSLTCECVESFCVLLLFFSEKSIYDFNYVPFGYLPCFFSTCRLCADEMGSPLNEVSLSEKFVVDGHILPSHFKVTRI